MRGQPDEQIGGLLPGADVGVLAFAAGLSVCAQRHHIDFSLHAGIEVLIGPAPGIVGQFFQRGSLVGRHCANTGPVHQGLQALFGTWVALVVQLVEFEGLLNVSDVGAGSRDAGIVLRSVGPHFAELAAGPRGPVLHRLELPAQRELPSGLILGARPAAPR